MSSKPTAVDIAAWAESRAAAAAGVLSRSEQYQIVVASKRAGMTLMKLAAEFGRTEGDVGRVLAEWTDTTDAAKHLLKARALELTDRLMTDADPGVALDVLERLQVVEASSKGAAPGLIIQIGGTANDIKIALLDVSSPSAPTGPDAV